jgi:hypothetical protein
MPDHGWWRRALPSTHAVTAFAVGAHRPSVEIRVAARALHRSFGKYFRDVAKITGNVFVHAPQWKAGLLVMTKLRLRAKRNPTCNRMAIFASDF